MAKGLIVTTAVVLGLMGAGVAAAAPQSAAKPQSRQCFRASDWQGGWKATPDGQTMYINTGINRVYRLDLTQACPELNSIGASLITRTDQSYICRPIDLNMRVLRPGLSVSYCQVKKITRLSAEDAKALPRALKP